MEREPNSIFHFPPGFRFHPSDEELIIHYLQNKVTSRPLPASVIAEIDLYKYNPWELPKKALFGEDEWYFFSPRDRKYPNGERPNRAAASGYWKATGTDKHILSSSGSKSIGVKKALVFYTGRPPKGVKTEWIMNEYRQLDKTTKPSRLKGSMRLDDWVLCRVRKKGNISKNTLEVQDSCSTELMRYSPTIEKMQPTFAHCRTNMITDCLNQGCQVLALSLARQALSPMEMNSTATFQGSNSFISVSEEGSDNVNLPLLLPSLDNYFTPVSEEGSYNMNLPLLLPSLDNYFTPLKRKLSFGNMQENLIQSNKKLNNDKKNEDFLPIKILPKHDLNYRSQNQSQDEIYNPYPPDSMIEFPELNGWPSHICLR